MAEKRVQRRLAAILAADVAGYSRLMGEDEEGTLATLTAHLKELIEPCIAEHRGRVVKTTGDGLLAEFASVVDAVRCAAAFQEGMAERNADAPEDRRMEFRVGVNLGDVIVQDDDVFGDGVNVAARMEGLAEPGGICVSGTVFDQIKGKLDLELDDLGPQMVKNIAEAVRIFRVRIEGVNPAADVVSKALPLPDKPSIAVLPFENMSGDPEQEYFADGLTEDTITTLSQVSSLFVVARNSSFAFKGKNPDVRDAGRQLGVRYVLEGSVRRSGDRLRVTAQLIDATDGAHVWAERYDRQIHDIFDIQDELTKEIVTALRIKLTDGEQASIWLRSTNNVEAWGYAVRGADHIWRGTAADMAQARSFLERAVVCEPTFAKAAALISLTHYFDVRFNYTPSKEESEREAAEWATKALELDPSDQYAAMVRCLVMTFEGRFEEAVEGIRQVLARSPNDAFCWLVLARLLVNAEQSKEAEQAIRHAMRLNPFYPINYLAVLGDALVHQGRNEEALDIFHELVNRQPDYVSAHLHLAGLYGSLGEIERAREAVTEVLRINPQYRVTSAASFYLSSDEDRKRNFLDHLRKAGLPG
ncbi:MAG: adenylate/guanylate cyclase domain-containing protein [Pseudomonadales bacterium]